MKNSCKLFFLLCCTSIFSQVGIGTTDPTVMLDVNGELRLRTIVEEIDPDVVADSILVIARNGVVRRVEAKTVYDSHIKSAVKGQFNGSGSINLTLTSGIANINFDLLDFDMNTEYDTSTGIFQAKQDGIYQITVQIKGSSGIAVTANFGVAVHKNGVLYSNNNFANVGVLGVNITPPVRSLNTLVKLDKDDTINFMVMSSLGTVALSGIDADTQFSIHQIK